MARQYSESQNGTLGRLCFPRTPFSCISNILVNELIQNSIKKPLMRWAGSKRQLLPVLRKCIPEFRKYIEPFSGSACLYFDLLPSQAVLSDNNPDLVQAFIYLQHSPYKLFLKLCSFPQTSKFYYQLRSADWNALDELEKSARFFYLNRFCFNGVYRTNKAGDFNVPRGTRTGQLLRLDELKIFSSALQSARLFCRDFFEAVHDIGPGDFVYLDPPYAKGGTRPGGEYGASAFSYSDLPRLLDFLRRIEEKKAYFLLSYADDPYIKAHCKQWNMNLIPARRHIAGFSEHRSIVQELLVANYDLPRL